MFRRFSRLFMVVWSLAVINGCAYTSSFVYDIGERTLHGVAIIDSEIDILQVNLDSFELEGPIEHIKHAGNTPYSHWYPDYQANPSGYVVVDFSDIEWESSSYGTLEVEHFGTHKTFTVRVSGSNNDLLILENDYKEWFGYPAQALLLVTIPLDGVINLTIAAIGLVAPPIVSIYQSITSDLFE